VSSLLPAVTHHHGEPARSGPCLHTRHRGMKLMCPADTSRSCRLVPYAGATATASQGATAPGHGAVLEEFVPLFKRKCETEELPLPLVEKRALIRPH
jgi:hypothetical protein